MTGKDLIIYILEHDLVNKNLSNNLIDGLKALESDEIAVRFQVGKTTSTIWVERGVLDGFKIGNRTYVLPTNKFLEKIYLKK